MFNKIVWCLLMIAVLVFMAKQFFVKKSKERTEISDEVSELEREDEPAQE